MIAEDGSWNLDLFRVLKEGVWNPINKKWKIVWKCPGPQRVRVFLWMVLQGRLLSNVERVWRGILDDSSCLICGHYLEDVLHILRDCPTAKDVCAQVNPTHIIKERVCLNTDGAVHLDSRLAAAWGIVRDKAGNWIGGFPRFLAKQALIEKANMQEFDVLPKRTYSLIDKDKHMCATFT
ncbi:hypothetical protein PVK06_019394 [Gossypium arboreum]|uniref:Reverse transcriptase zinc-binding domain-containing protein n=1 Tax=Gossypium arboreum TaxID=29729 RepID=A0ABR0PJQ4_GOSAR|nr:hypothetical protein PVK06_019394 [Gossypium arboreum]